MDPLTALALANGLLTLLETLAPKIREMTNSGEITTDQQAALNKRIDALRTGGTAFTGPEWEVKP